MRKVSRYLDTANARAQEVSIMPKSSPGRALPKQQAGRITGRGYYSPIFQAKLPEADKVGIMSKKTMKDKIKLALGDYGGVGFSMVASGNHSFTLMYLGTSIACYKMLVPEVVQDGCKNYLDYVTNRARNSFD